MAKVSTAAMMRVPLHASVSARAQGPIAARTRRSRSPAPSRQAASRRKRPLGPWEKFVDSRPVQGLMGVHISGVVAAIAALPGMAAWALRTTLPLPVSVVLWHISGSGMLVAAAATEALAGRTTGLLGKVSA